MRWHCTRGHTGRAGLRRLSSFLRCLVLPRASQVAPKLKNLPANPGDVRDSGSIPGLGRSPGEGHDNPLQHSCLENFMDRGAWRAETHRASVRLSIHHCQGKNKIPGQRHASYCLKVAKIPSTHISWTKASHRFTYTFKATGVCHGTETVDKPLCLCFLK